MATVQSAKTGTPNQGPCAQNPLEIVVIHTTTRGTLEALRAAAGMAQGLAAHIRILVPQIVPYPQPLSIPLIRTEFTERRFRTLAAGIPIETRIEVYLCRDRWTAVESVLSRRSLILLSRKRRWWPTTAPRAAKQLRRAGHEVVLVNY